MLEVEIRVAAGVDMQDAIQGFLKQSAEHGYATNNSPPGSPPSLERLLRLQNYGHDDRHRSTFRKTKQRNQIHVAIAPWAQDYAADFCENQTKKPKRQTKQTKQQTLSLTSCPGGLPT